MTMVPNKTSLTGIIQGAMDYAYFPVKERPASPPCPSLEMPCRHPASYKINSALSSTNKLGYFDCNNSNDMATTDSSYHWFDAHGLGPFDQEVRPNTSYPQYASSEVDAIGHGYGEAMAGTAPYVYHFPQDLSPSEAASTFPRSYPGDINLATLEMKDAYPEAYPPAPYLMDPEKHELYMTFTKQPASEQQSFAEQEQEALAALNLGQNGTGGTDQSSHSPTTLVCSSQPDLTRSRPSDCKSLNDEVTKNESDKAMDDETDPEGNEPYAKLIYRALKSAPGNRMVLKDIYEWFALHTDKNKDPSQKGWQNSIRHNLSMNGAFKKVEQDSSSEDNKKGFVWVLEPTALEEGGVKSTTRYRKSGGGKKSGRSDAPVLQRQTSGRKGGQAARRGKSAKAKRLENAASCITSIPSHRRDFDVSHGFDRAASHPLSGAAYPHTFGTLSDTQSIFPYDGNQNAALSPPPKLEDHHFTLGDIEGVVPAPVGQPLFCDDFGTGDDSIMHDFPVEGPNITSF